MFCLFFRSVIVSQCPMAPIKEDQPAARVLVTHPVLMEVEVTMEVLEVPSPILSAHLSWQTPNSREPTWEAMQLQLTC